MTTAGQRQPEHVCMTGDEWGCAHPSHQGHSQPPVVLVMDDGYGVVDEVYGPFPAYDTAEEWAEAHLPNRLYRVRRLRPATADAITPQVSP